MSWQDIVGKVLKKGMELGRDAMDGVQKMNAEREEKYMTFQEKTDFELKQIAQSGWSSFVEKGVACQILKERGYNSIDEVN